MSARIVCAMAQLLVRRNFFSSVIDSKLLKMFLHMWKIFSTLQNQRQWTVGRYSTVYNILLSYTVCARAYVLHNTSPLFALTACLPTQMHYLYLSSISFSDSSVVVHVTGTFHAHLYESE